MDDSKPDKIRIKEAIVDVLQTCYDPEIPVNIYELGLIYEVNVDDDLNVDVKMTLTSPACPVAGTLPTEVEQKIANIHGVKCATVSVVWEPTWTPEMMSDIARYELGML